MFTRRKFKSKLLALKIFQLYQKLSGIVLFSCILRFLRDQGTLFHGINGSPFSCASFLALDKWFNQSLQSCTLFVVVH